jgi:hypothetical protein
VADSTDEPAAPEEPDATDDSDATDDTDDPDATDDSDAVEADGAWERPIDRFRRSGAGTAIAAGLLGVRDALEGRPEREEPAIVTQAPEPKLDHIDIVLDPEHPERSRAIVYLPSHDDDPTD